MSIKERLGGSGLVSKTSLQSNQTMTFEVRQGASIYVQKNDLDFDLLQGALENGKFPNSGELLRYAKIHRWRTMRSPNDPAHAYRLRGLRALMR